MKIGDVVEAILISVLSAFNAIGIWFEQKWSIFTVSAVVVAGEFLQTYLSRPSYVMLGILTIVIWAQVEVFVLGKKGNKTLKESADKNSPS